MRIGVSFVAAVVLWACRVNAGMSVDSVTGILHTFAAGSWDNDSAIVGPGVEFTRLINVASATAVLTLDIADSSFTLKYVNNIQPKPGNDGSFNLGLDGFEFTDLNQGFKDITFAGSTGGFPTNSISKITVTSSNIHIFMDEPIIPGATTWTVKWNITFSGPKLTIVRSGSNVIISWPTEFQGYTLQHAVSLVGNNWAAVSTTGNTITYPTGRSTAQYFRLMK
jgi:hypothetical protein